MSQSEKSIPIFDVTCAGVWWCGDKLDYAHCALDGQSYIGCDFPPDIADLDRVWTDGPSAGTQTWRADGADVVLTVSIVRPVRLQFGVRLHRPTHDGPLHDIDHFGDLLLCQAPHPEIPPRIAFWDDGATDGLDEVLRADRCPACTHWWINHGRLDGCVLTEAGSPMICGCIETRSP
jgi:hypothetical protein